MSVGFREENRVIQDLFLWALGGTAGFPEGRRNGELWVNFILPAPLERVSSFSIKICVFFLVMEKMLLQTLAFYVFQTKPFPLLWLQ